MSHQDTIDMIVSLIKPATLVVVSFVTGLFLERYRSRNTSRDKLRDVYVKWLTAQSLVLRLLYEFIDKLRSFQRNGSLDEEQLLPAAKSIGDAVASAMEYWHAAHLMEQNAERIDVMGSVHTVSLALEREVRSMAEHCSHHLGANHRFTNVMGEMRESIGQSFGMLSDVLNSNDRDEGRELERVEMESVVAGMEASGFLEDAIAARKIRANVERMREISMELEGNRMAMREKLKDVEEAEQALDAMQAEIADWDASCFLKNPESVGRMEKYASSIEEAVVYIRKTMARRFR